MSLAIYNNLKKSMFFEALEFISTKYALCEEGQEEETIKGLWGDFKKYEQEKGVNKVSKKKKVVPEEDRCTHLKSDGSRCSMRKCSEAVMKKHPEYNPNHCATHNRNDLTPKKGKTTTKAKKYVCGHKKRNGDICETKVSEEGDKCKVYKNMMANRALKKKVEQESEEEKTPTKKKVEKKVEEEDKYEGDTEEIEEEEENNEESEDEKPTSTKKSPKRVVVESDDEEED